MTSLIWSGTGCFTNCTHMATVDVERSVNDTRCTPQSYRTSLACYSTQVNAPCLTSAKGWYSIYLPRRDGRL